MIRDTLATFTTQEKSVKEIEDLIAEREGQFFVATEGTALTGFVTFGPFRSGPGYAETCEHSIVVAPAAQGQQIGGRLMHHAETAARARGYHVMVAAISGANLLAVEFHTVHKFTTVGHLPEVGQKAGQRLDLILMQKNLMTDR